MPTTLYLVRHAQSMPTSLLPSAQWPLSPVGARQAEQLADLLSLLEITQVFSSPFVRSIKTAQPFAEKHDLEIQIVEDLRERVITNQRRLPSEEVWCKSWEDFNFCLPECESSLTAQTRMCRAVAGIAQAATGTAAVFTHGNVIGLFLNQLTNTFGQKETEALTNPDILKIRWNEEVFTWEREFYLDGLRTISTNHSQTPVTQP